MQNNQPQPVISIALEHVVASKWIVNTEVAVSRVGIMITPNQPKYRRLLVDVMNDANLSQGESERSERSQIEDVTNYCSNVAQGFDESR